MANHAFHADLIWDGDDGVQLEGGEYCECEEVVVVVTAVDLSCDGGGGCCN